jgi:hypothetical protein
MSVIRHIGDAPGNNDRDISTETAQHDSRYSMLQLRSDDSSEEAMRHSPAFVEIVQMRTQIHNLSSDLHITSTQLQSTMSELVDTKHELRLLRESITQSSIAQCSMAQSSYPPFPQYIGAASDASSSSSAHTSFMANSSSSGDQLHPAIVVTATTSQVIGLKCPFCPKIHFKEKSHWQHLDRLMSRLIDPCVYIGKCFVSDDHWLYRRMEGSKKEAAVAFIKKYNSHLASSHAADVDPDRAQALQLWLRSFWAE